MDLESNMVKNENILKPGLNLNMCRLCLSEEYDHLEPVYFNDNSPDEVLLQKIFDFTTIHVEFASDFPSSICEMCKSRLDEYAQFRIQCIENNELLKLKYFEIKSAEQYAEEIKAEQNEIAVDDNENLQQYQYEKHEGETIQYIVQQDGQEIIHVNDYSTEDGATVNNGIYYTDGTETYEFEAGQPTEIEYAQLENITNQYQEGAIINSDGTSSQMNIILSRGIHDRPYVCKHCKTSFKYEYNYQRHMKNHAKTLYKCGKCSKTFTKMKKCQQHFLKAHSMQRYECDICFRTYSLPTRLENHIIEMHSENGIYKCDRCSEKFTTYLDFKSHRKTHTEVKVTCNCEHCITGNTAAHQQEAKADSTADFEMLIDQTSKSTRIIKPSTDVSSSAGEEDHQMQDDHDDDDDDHDEDDDDVILVEEQEIKEKNTLHRQLLQEIEASEQLATGPKIHQCNNCTKSFAELNNLKAHIYAEHDTNKPFKCKLCPISFKTKEILVMHMVLHSQNNA